MATLYGTAGDDNLIGSGADDDFHLEDGGQDTAVGGAGVDAFYMGASFDAGDRIVGGGGRDFLVLDGDYSEGVELRSTSMRGIDSIRFAAGHDYTLTGIADINVAGSRFTVDGRQLQAGDDLHIDASAVTGPARFYGGAGDDLLVGGVHGASTFFSGGGSDTLVGGANSDTFYLQGGRIKALGNGGNDYFTDQSKGVSAGFTGSDKINGGGGFDTLNIYGTYDRLHLGPHALLNIEQVSISAVTDLTVTLSDRDVAAGGSISINVYGYDHTALIDGSADSDGRLFETVNYGASTMIGGGGDDVLTDYYGYSKMVGGDGADSIVAYGYDTVIGGHGADDLYNSGGVARFVYGSVEDSTPDVADTIHALNSGAVVDLSRIDANANAGGDQAFHLVDAFSGHAGELVVAYDTLRKETTIQGDTDGDGQADLLIQVDGDQHGFTNFVL